MKKAIASLLALVMVMSLFAGCGKEKAPAFDTTALEAGTYEVVDDDETIAVLVSTGKKLTVYDAEGEDGETLMEEAKFTYDEDEESFLIDDTAAFSLSYEDGTVTITVPKKSPLGIKKGDYTLKAEGADKDDDEEEGSGVELAKGWYAVIDEDGETVAYLESTGKKVTAYDAALEELMEEAKFAYDEDEEAFLIDDTAAFTLTVEKKTTTITVPKKSPLGIDKGDYTLEACEDPREAGTGVADPSPADPDVGTVVESRYVKLPDGIYEVSVDGMVCLYYIFSGSEVRMVYTDGTEDPDVASIVYAADNSCALDETTTGYFTKNNDGTYNLLMVEGDESIEVTLRAINESDLPVSNAGSLYYNPGEANAVVTFNGKTLYSVVPNDLCSVEPYMYTGSTCSYTSLFCMDDYTLQCDYQLNAPDYVYGSTADEVLEYLQNYYTDSEAENIVKTNGWNFTSNGTEWRWRLDWIQEDGLIEVAMMLISVDGIGEVTLRGYANTEEEATALEQIIVDSVVAALYIQ